MYVAEMGVTQVCLTPDTLLVFIGLSLDYTAPLCKLGKGAPSRQTWPCGRVPDLATEQGLKVRPPSP